MSGRTAHWDIGHQRSWERCVLGPTPQSLRRPEDTSVTIDPTLTAPGPQNGGKSAGHPGEWTWLDVETARQQANTTARPRGLSGPTPEELWTGREALSAGQRQRFQESVARRRQEVQEEGGNGVQDDEGGGQG